MWHGTNSSPPDFKKSVVGNPLLRDLDVGNGARPTFADVTGDGLLDCVIGTLSGEIVYLINTGNVYKTAFLLVPRFTTDGDPNLEHPFSHFEANNRSAPTLADIDGDNVLDAIVGDGTGELHYLQKRPFGYSPETNNNPFADFSVHEHAMPTFEDVDIDDDIDLVVGERSGRLNYYENIGSLNAPEYEQRFFGDNPFHDIDVGSGSAPTFSDFDADGDPNLVVGKYKGYLQYYLNQRVP